MKIGLEQEFFVMRDGHPIVCPHALSADDSGVLAEARGGAFDRPTDAVFSLKASVYDLSNQADKLNLFLSTEPLMFIPRKTRIQASRAFPKGLTKYQNLYGYEHHRNRVLEQTSGIHISFTNEHHYIQEKARVPYNAMFDFVQIFKKLDEAFKEEIRQSKRNPGFYELKTDGRIEYRSLPSNVDMDKLIDVLTTSLPAFC